MKTINSLPLLLYKGFLFFRKCIGIGMIGLLLFSCSPSGKKDATASDSTNTASESESNTAGVIPQAKKYGIKSGIVTFQNDAMGMKLKTVLYFDDYGAKELEEKYDLDNQLEGASLCDGSERYNLNWKDKTAFSAGTCSNGIAYRFDWEEVSKADPEYKATKLANVNVAGKDCESFSLVSNGNTITYAGWNHICMLIDQPTQYGKVTLKAVSIEENANIPAEKFKLPEGFQLK